MAQRRSYLLFGQGQSVQLRQGQDGIDHTGEVEPVPGEEHKVCTGAWDGEAVPFYLDQGQPGLPPNPGLLDCLTTEAALWLDLEDNVVLPARKGRGTC